MTWPTKTDFSDGDVLSAAQMNNIGTNLNEADPTGITDGYVLTADGAGGMGWEAVAAGGGYTLLASGTFTNGFSTQTLTGYSLDYKHLEIWYYNFSLSTANNLAVRGSVGGVENFSGGTYVYSNIRNTNTSVSASGGNGSADFFQLDFAITGLIGGNTNNWIRVCVPYYSSTDNPKYAYGTANFWNNSGQNSSDYSQSFVRRNTGAAIDAVRIFSGGGAQLNNMKYALWGID